LLRNASYDLYKAGDWFAKEREFEDVLRGPEEGAWDLARSPGLRRLTVSARLPNGRGLLTLPNGVSRIRRLPAGAVKKNRLGSVQTEYALPLAVYSAEYGSGEGRDAPPGEIDLRLSEGSRKAVEDVAGRLGLKGMRSGAAVAAVARFLREGFSYSIYREAPPRGTDPVADFLTRTKSGHCEYFATATVLLLRAAGVPARYATGYSVAEYSSLEKAWILRQRHAHAWARAFVNERWTDVDTTPPSWLEIEERRAPFWQPVNDFVSWGRNAFLEWRIGEGSANPAGRLVWVLLPLLGFMIWRVYASVRGRPAERRGIDAVRGASSPGLDSELFEVERVLAGKGFARRGHEPFGAWIRRLQALPVPPKGVGSLEPLAALHSRHRFDPEGLRPEERTRLRDGARDWLAENRRDDDG